MRVAFHPKRLVRETAGAIGAASAAGATTCVANAPIFVDGVTVCASPIRVTAGSNSKATLRLPLSVK